MGYIYLRKNLSNGKCYVGQTKDIERRNNDWNNLNWRYGGILIERARAKYGADGFSFEILKECGDDEMNYWEKYYVKLYNSKKPYGYNSTDGGDSIYEITEETKAKMAAAKRGKPNPKSAAARRGKPNPKSAAARRGRKLSEETKARMSVAQKTSEKAKIGRTKAADALRGRKRPAEVVAKVAAAHRGMKRSEEAKEKMSVAQTNHPKKSKPVQALKDGNVVMEFPSIQEAQRQGFNQGAVSQCCCNCYIRSGNNVYKGYIWRFAS
jgi:group I intron endonuclease